jgi:hypothetical protein
MGTVAQKEMQDEMDQLRTSLRSGTVTEREASQKLAAKMMSTQKRLESEQERLQRELNKKMEEADVRLNEYINRIQGKYKLWSVVLPPIPPLVIALTVFFVRRIRESEGVPLSRRKK